MCLVKHNPATLLITYKPMHYMYVFGQHITLVHKHTQVNDENKEKVNENTKSMGKITKEKRGELAIVTSDLFSFAFPCHTIH